MNVRAIAADGADELAPLLERFGLKVGALGATIHLCEDLHAAAELLPEGAYVAGGTLAERFPLFRRSEQGDGAHPDVAAAGLFGVAGTGSVALAASTEERAACFLAERLWLLVRTTAVMATPDEALARVERFVAEGRTYLTLMTGPSRTADIERTLTIGVHGPRELHVVVVGDESASP